MDHVATESRVEGRSAAEVVASLRTVFATGRTRDLSWRQAQLDGLHRLLVEREADLVAALCEDLRRTEFESVLFDIVPTKAEVAHARKRVARWMRSRRVPAPVNIWPGRAWYDYEPLGTVLVIGAWNYPVHLALTPVVGALAAGNCVVLKPSELAPASSRVLADLLPRYLDPDAVAVVEGDAEVTQELLAQGMDHCFFTGSPAVGRAVMAAAAPHLTPVTLELGGKCPAVVTASANLEVTARRIAFGKLVNSGQTCVAPDYVLVDNAVKESLVERLTATMKEFSQGRAMPVLGERHARRLAGLISDADCASRTVLGGGVDIGQAMVEPTVVVDPPAGSELLAEEIFGPILPVVGVDDLDGAIAHIRRGTKPLASYLFTASRDDETHFLHQVSAGGTVVNHVMVHLAVSNLPFGGVGTSGTGRYHGHWGFETFSNAKAVVRQGTRIDPTFIYPPYSERVQKILRKMM